VKALEVISDDMAVEAQNLLVDTNTFTLCSERGWAGHGFEEYLNTTTCFILNMFLRIYLYIYIYNFCFMNLIVTLANVWNMRMRDRPACIIMIMFTIKRKEFNNKSRGVVWSGPK
jgi:hypothetical protein